GADVGEELAHVLQAHAAGGFAATVDGSHEQFRTVLADSHGRPRMRRSREIVVERRDLTVLDDLVSAGDTAIDVFVRSDLDVDLIADLEFGQSLRSGIAAQQNLAVGGDIGIARLVVETGDLCDRAVDDGGPGDFGGHVVRTADWTVEGVVAPR